MKQINQIRIVSLQIESNKASGSVEYKGIHMAYHINERGDKRYRGRLVVKDDCGRNLKNKQQHDVTTEFLLDDLNEETISQALQSAAERVYSNNVTLIEKKASNGCKPDTITVAVACDRFGYDYIAGLTSRARSEKGGERSKENKLRKLKNVAKIFPNKPMMEISPECATKVLKLQDQSSIKMIHGLWDYCIDKQLCTGNNPITVSPKRKRDKRAAASKKVTELTILSESMQDDLFATIKKFSTGADMGIALLIGTGKPVEDILNFKWSDIEFKDYYGNEKKGYALLMTKYPRNCPIQDGSKLITPISADILKNKYNELVYSLGKERVDALKIVAQASNPFKSLGKDAFLKRIKYRINSVLMSNPEFIEMGYSMGVSVVALLKKTYESNVINKLGFFLNSEMTDFLLGTIDYKDTTSLNYLSFTSPDAIDRYYHAMKILSKREKIDVNDDLQIKAIPETTQDYAAMEISVVLKAGQAVNFNCFNGVDGSIDVK